MASAVRRTYDWRISGLDEGASVPENNKIAEAILFALSPLFEAPTKGFCRATECLSRYPHTV